TDTSSLQTGQMQITISGGHFSEPTTYTLIDPEQSAYVFDTSFSILYTGGTTVTGSDGETTLDSFTFSAPERSGEGGYTASEFEFQFNITGLTGEDVTLSFADEEEDGSLTVETSSDGILAGTFESDARVTQMDETEPVYHIVGSFRFAY
ncbi:MAG: hypothetical protein KC561_08295, partial [Myxococcales bacterium]|nr:hypothetical protein [Myxococcales bacterium]